MSLQPPEKPLKVANIFDQIDRPSSQQQLYQLNHQCQELMPPIPIHSISLDPMAADNHRNCTPKQSKRHVDESLHSHGLKESSYHKLNSHPSDRH